MHILFDDADKPEITFLAINIITMCVGSI